jgi:hypothetical protein
METQSIASEEQVRQIIGAHILHLKSFAFCGMMVARNGAEPPTPAFSVLSAE